MTLYMAKGFNKGGGGKGERFGAKVPEGAGEFFKLGFTCNKCFHHRTVMIHIKTGLTADYKSGTHPENGDSFAKYIIQILSSATQEDVIEAVGEAHRLTFTSKHKRNSSG